MSDETFDPVAGLPILSARHGLTLKNDSLIKRGLDLAVRSAGPSSTALAELVAARSFCDLADGLLNPSDWDADLDLRLNDDRTLIDASTWDAFALRCRDAYRHALAALSIHLQMDPDEPRARGHRLEQSRKTWPFLGISSVPPTRLRNE